MAQNVWLNATADPAAAKKLDSQDHVHTVSGGATASGDFTVSYDSAKVTNLATFDSLVAAARRRAQSAGLK